MVFTGPELLQMLSVADDGIELRNEYGRHCRMLSRLEALRLDVELFVGVGNRRRLRFLRPATLSSALNAGSRTTRRMDNGFGIHIAGPWVREHKPPAGVTK